jgi:hypothetical protein
MRIKTEEFQKLFERKALVYEELGKEHFPIRNLEAYDKRCDISAHLHCEIVELWLSIVQNQSIEQVFDELVDILCLWNLALVQYKNAGGIKINLKKMVEEALKIIKAEDYLNLIPDSRKDWKIYPDNIESDFIKTIDESIRRNNIKCIFNFGSGNEIDIISLYHKVVNDFWNSVRKNKELDELYNNLVAILAVWLLSVRVISKHMKYDISLDNIIEIANEIFTYVAKKKFNISI